jgi:hypothetical protein
VKFLPLKAFVVLHLVLSLAFSVGRTHAQIVVDAGHHNLLPNTPGQQIEITVTGGGPVSGVDFHAQVTDGYPEVPGSALDGPNITAIDLLGTEQHPTIFFTNNATQQDPGSGTQLAFRSVTTASGTVPAEGLLAIVTVDTTGFSSGEFPFRLKDISSEDGPTFFVNADGVVSAEITDGVLSIAKANQTISFNPIPDATLGDPPIALSASASSGLLVEFTVVSGAAQVSSNSLTLTGAGSVTVRATQAGNDRYNAAPSVERTFLVNSPPANVVVSGAFGVGRNDFEIVLTSTPARSCILETSPDLIEWTPLQTNSVEQSGLLKFVDPNARALPLRFYRVRFP